MQFSMMVLKISMPSCTQFHWTSQLSWEIGIEIQEWLPFGCAPFHHEALNVPVGVLQYVHSARIAA